MVGKGSFEARSKASITSLLFCFCIISTSANLSNTPTPTHFDSISKEILEGVDYIVPLPQNNATSQPSRVIKIDENGAVTVIRP